MASIPTATHLQLHGNELEVEFVDRKAQLAIRPSAQRILDKIERDIRKPSDCILNYRDLVWPQINRGNFKKIKPRLRIVPLERLGAAPGKSGSRVMVAYFTESRKPENKDYWSTPMVLKIEEAIGPTKNKLRDENNNAAVVRRFAANTDRFALPFEFWDQGGHNVLWSKFTHNARFWNENSGEYWLGLDDLRGLLKDQCKIQGAKAGEVIRDAVGLLRSLHGKGLPPKYRDENIVRHYCWYLRDILDKRLQWPSSSSDWAAPWKSVWANHTQENISFWGRRWKNPFWVLDQLRRLRRPQRLLCGVVHGDFHPRNIVLAGTAQPHIIDFGWSGDDRHIGQDFVLLECNLRFLVQQPALPFADLQGLSSWIEFGSRGPSPLTTDYVRNRVRLIAELRNAACTHFPLDTNWDIEYIIPLFLTSLGLLKHMTDCENQLAGHLTILSLANYISSNVLPRIR